MLLSRVRGRRRTGVGKPSNVVIIIVIFAIRARQSTVDTDRLTKKKNVWSRNRIGCTIKTKTMGVYRRSREINFSFYAHKCNKIQCELLTGVSHLGTYLYNVILM